MLIVVAGTVAGLNDASSVDPLISNNMMHPNGVTTYAVKKKAPLVVFTEKEEDLGTKGRDANPPVGWMASCCRRFLGILQWGVTSDLSRAVGASISVRPMGAQNVTPTPRHTYYPLSANHLGLR